MFSDIEGSSSSLRESDSLEPARKGFLRSTSARVDPGDVGREAAVEVRRGEGEELAGRFDDLEESHITPVAEGRHGQKVSGYTCKRYSGLVHSTGAI